MSPRNIDYLHLLDLYPLAESAKAIQLLRQFVPQQYDSKSIYIVQHLGDLWISCLNTLLGL